MGFFLMEEFGAFYFVENFKLLAGFLHMGIFSEFLSLELEVVTVQGRCALPGCSAQEQPVLTTLTCSSGKMPLTA